MQLGAQRSRSSCARERKCLAGGSAWQAGVHVRPGNLHEAAGRQPRNVVSPHTAPHPSALVAGRRRPCVRATTCSDVRRCRWALTAVPCSCLCTRRPGRVPPAAVRSGGEGRRQTGRRPDGRAGPAIPHLGSRSQSRGNASRFNRYDIVFPQCWSFRTPSTIPSA